MAKTIVINLAAESPKRDAGVTRKADVERRAASLVEFLVGGSRCVRLDQGKGMQVRDFDIVMEDGQTEPLEVTCATLDALEEGRAAHAKHLPEYVIRAVQGVHYDWHLIASERVQFRKLSRATIAAPLIEMEAAGMRRWFVSRDARKFPALGKMGFHAAFRWGERNQQAIGEVVIGPPNDAHEWVSSHDDPGANVLSAVETAASQPDNRKKLRGHSASLRHIFVWVTDTNYLPWRDLFAGALPNRAPALPPEITAVWVAAALPGGDAIWRWLADAGWTSSFVSVEARARGAEGE